MAPIIELGYEALRVINPNIYTRRKDLENTCTCMKSELDGFIYVPSIKLYIAEEKTLFDKTQDECQAILHSNNQRMPTIPEFREFLKYTKENHIDIYNEITQLKSPWRAERLDADFKVQGKNLVVNYHGFENGKIVRKSEVLDKNTLMKDKRISLENWINSSHTKQGLPSKNVQKGYLYFWNPRSDNNSVAWFSAYSGRADLGCDRNPSCQDSEFGVRAVRHE